MRIFLVTLMVGFLCACGDHAATDLPDTEKSSADVEQQPAQSEPAAKEITPATYPDHWDVSAGWGGEYPNGFAVIADGVELDGRAEPHPSVEKTLTCPVDYLGMYHPWNSDAGRDLKYVTATETYPITLDEDIALDAFLVTDAPPSDQISISTQLTIPAGTPFQYIRYIAEGFAIISYGDTLYEVSMEWAEQNQNAIGETGLDEWMEIPCGDHRGWVLYSETMEIDSIAEYSYFINGWGESRDITEDQIENYKRIKAENEAYAREQSRDN